jgi:outer membrane lipoprotein SlyB
MKKSLISFFSAVALVSQLSSCAGGPNSQTGAVLGGLGGAAVGGIIGNQSGRGLEGAAIGAGLGALGGAAIGNAQDQRNSAYQRQYHSNHSYYRPGPYQNSGYGYRGY